MEVERTLVIFKPDALQRGMVSKLLRSWERKGLRIVALRLEHASLADMERHYAEHKGKPFYEALVTRMSSAPSVFAIISGPNIIRWSRDTIVALRHQFATSTQENLVHGSDSLEAAEREIAIWFPAHSKVN